MTDHRAAELIHELDHLRPHEADTLTPYERATYRRAIEVQHAHLTPPTPHRTPPHDRNPMTTDAHNPADRPPAEPKTTRLYSRGTPVRNVRLDDDTWHRVTTAAETAGLTASDVIRAALDAHLHA